MSFENPIPKIQDPGSLFEFFFRNSNCCTSSSLHLLYVTLRPLLYFTLRSRPVLYFRFTPSKSKAHAGVRRIDSVNRKVNLSCLDCFAQTPRRASRLAGRPVSAITMPAPYGIRIVKKVIHKWYWQLKTKDDIADDLLMSPKTVRKYIRNWAAGNDPRGKNKRGFYSGRSSTWRR